jgi:2-dehydropantoate 2-reductase
MWEKWILLGATGAITCLMRGTIGEVVACPEGVTFSESLLDEVVAIVRAVGEPPSEALLKSAREQLTAQGSQLASSMYRDLIRGRSIEAEAIVGDQLHRGVAAGLRTPLLSAAHTHLTVYQNARREAAPIGG